MPKYEKWLGAGLGWAVGGPLGGLLGYMAGNLMGGNKQTGGGIHTEGLTELEVNLIVLASHLIKVDGTIQMAEVNFTNSFLNTHFNEQHSAKRSQVISHCLQKEYDLTNTCTQLRSHTPHATRVQIVRFLFDLAMCDGELHERENYFIFRIAGYLNINDVDFRKIKAEHSEKPVTIYSALELDSTATMAEIRTAYRKLVLLYHPDRNKNATPEEKKALALKFQRIQEAYEQIKKLREG